MRHQLKVITVIALGIDFVKMNHEVNENGTSLSELIHDLLPLLKTITRCALMETMPHLSHVRVHGNHLATIFTGY